MRDPVAPIPSPVAPQPAARRFWEQAGPPPTPPRAAGEPTAVADRSYDPVRLLPADAGDPLGIDRRRQRRKPGQFQPDGFPAPGHESFDAIFGLATRNGWALVRGLSLAPGGVLLHFLDLMARGLPASERARGQQVFHQLTPHLGTFLRQDRTASSPLAAVGSALLGQRVVEDLSTWMGARRTAARTSRTPPGHATSVSLVLPVGSPLPTGRTNVARIPGTLVPLTDPNPHVLAVSLSLDGLRELREVLAVDHSRARGFAEKAQSGK